VFTDLSSTALVLKNTVILGTATATIGTILALVIAYVTTRRVNRGGNRVLGFLATRACRGAWHRARRRPVLELYRGRPSCFTARCGSC